VSKLGEQAVVCGAGMGGLLAARVLSEFYGTVTAVERDELPDAADQRRGVPQGRHFHVLWSRGADELARLFPGIHDDLIAGGAAVCDDGDLSRVSIRLAGHELSRAGKFSDPTAVKLHLLSRPLLESQVRQRVSAIDNVEISTAMTSSIRSPRLHSESSVRTSSTVTAAPSESSTPTCWSMRWDAAHARRPSWTAWAADDRGLEARGQV
jgi:2-polyprenyl-6-methoxyphenol hydroxylase-like FAD-dependent oxidoreductase